MTSVRPWQRSSSMRLPLAIVLFGLVVLGLLWGAGFYEARRDQQAALDQARRDTAGYALAFREDVRRTITAIDQIMLAVKAEYARDPDHYRLPAWLDHSPLLTGMAVQVTLVGADGHVRQSNLGPQGRGVDLTDRPHIRYHLDPTAPQPYISVPVLGRVSKKWSIQITRRLERADGSYAGVLVVSLDPFYLSEFFEKIDLGQNGVVTLAGRDGIVRARRAMRSEDIGQDISQAPTFARFLAEDHGSFVQRSPIDGVERIYSFVSIPDYPLIVVVGEGRNEVLARTRAQRDRYLLIEGAVSLFVLLLVAMLLREAVRRRRREEALAGQAALLTTILDVTPAAIWVKDHAGRFELLNEATARLLGHSREAALGRTTPALLSSETAGRILEWDGSARLQPGTTVAGEHEVVFDDGTHYYLTFRRTCVAGDRVLLVGSGVDVTPLRMAEAALRAEMAQRETAEAQLRQAQKMETLGQLTGGVAHDFNNLLTTVLGNLELAERRETDGTKRHLLRNATRAAERGATLIHHLLAFARRQHLEPEPLDLNRLVGEAKEMLDRALGPAVRIETALGTGLWPALADANQVEVALLNVAINARDAMPEGGRLLVRTANIGAADPARPAELRPGDFVEIAVADEGEGMDAAVAAKAFEPFFTTKEVGKGSGLGLSQVYGMVQQSGGVVTLDSRRGEGTTVRIYLPRAIADAAVGTEAGPAGVPARAAPEAATILVVGDDYQVRDFVAVCLEEQGHAVFAVADAPAALAAAEGRPIDLAIIDVAMPGMAGSELARRLRQRLPDLPVLFMTGYAGPHILDRTDDAPILRKPFGSAKLVAEVQGMLAQARGAAPDAHRPAPGRDDGARRGL